MVLEMGWRVAAQRVLLAPAGSESLREVFVSQSGKDTVGEGAVGAVQETRNCV